MDNKPPLIYFGTSVRRSSRLAFGRPTGNDVSGYYFHQSFPLFSPKRFNVQKNILLVHNFSFCPIFSLKNVSSQKFLFFKKNICPETILILKKIRQTDGHLDPKYILTKKFEEGCLNNFPINQIFKLNKKN